MSAEREYLSSLLWLSLTISGNAQTEKANQYTLKTVSANHPRLSTEG